MKLSVLHTELQKNNKQYTLIKDCDFSGICTDTRNVKEGNLFVALRGEHFDGHAFIDQAIDSGACAIVVDTLVEGCSVAQLLVDDTTQALGHISTVIREKFHGVLVAITGSCGKTSVKGLLRCIFELAGKTLATKGNFNNHIGVPLTLNQLLPCDEYAVIEMGASGVGEIEYLANMAKPVIALVNNVHAAHVGGFGSIDAIALEKGKIYDALRCAEPSGTAIINCDDAYAPQYIAQTQGLKQLGFSVRPLVSNTDIECVYADNIHCNEKGFCQFTIHWGEEKQVVTLKILGEHFVANALAAAACALAAGVSLHSIVDGLACYGGESGRMQLMPSVYPEQKAMIINDAYNANPASVRAAIDYLARKNSHANEIETERETILVLGDMGELGEGETFEHTSIGLYALEQGITHLVAIGDLAALAAEVFSSAHTFKDLHSAAQWLSQFLACDSTILLKGSRSAGIDQLMPLLAEYYKGQN